MTLFSPVCKNDKFLRRMETSDQGRAGFLTQWRGTVTMGALGGGREARALPLVVFGVAATKAEVLRGIFQGVLPGAGQGPPAVLHGLCRGVLLCQSHLGPAPGHPISCRRMIKMIEVIITKYYLVSNGCDLKVVNCLESSLNLSSTNGIFLIACGER